MKTHYQILIGRKIDGSKDVQIIDVVCTADELRTIANALCAYENHNNTIYWCVAKEGKGVSSNSYDYMFADCM